LFTLPSTNGFGFFNPFFFSKSLAGRFLQRLINRGEIGRYMLLYLAVLINGAIILVIEILGTRILAPFYGSTLYVWASMISTALVFLSVGYFLGGALADRKPAYETFYLVLLMAGLSLLPIPWFSKNVLFLTNPLGPRLGALTSSILLFSVQFTLLGCVAPYAIRLKTTKIKSTGITAGSLYGIATIGSFLGALLAGFYLIPNFGIKTILYLSALSLIVLSVAWFMRQKKFSLMFLLPIVFLFYAANTGISEILPDEVFFKTESVYGQIKVIEKDDGLFLLVNGAVQTCVANERPCLKYPYTMGIATILFNETPETALVLGLGGGILAKGLIDAGIAADSVEIDPKIAAAAKDYFNFTGGVVVGDARRFVKSSEKKYNLIFLDTFNAFVPSPHLYTVEAFEDIKTLLEANGIFVINTLGWVKGDGSIIQRSVYKTLLEVYPYVYVLPLNQEAFDNVIFFASERKLDLSSHELGAGGIVLTDDYNPMEFWAVKGAEKARENTLNYFGRELLLS
jgi:spermidine synthase